MVPSDNKAKLIIRNARVADVVAIRDLSERVYTGTGNPTYPRVCYAVK